MHFIFPSILEPLVLSQGQLELVVTLPGIQSTLDKVHISMHTMAGGHTGAGRWRQVLVTIIPNRATEGLKI